MDLFDLLAYTLGGILGVFVLALFIEAPEKGIRWIWRRLKGPK